MFTKVNTGTKLTETDFARGVVIRLGDDYLARSLYGPGYRYPGKFSTELTIWKEEDGLYCSGSLTRGYPMRITSAQGIVGERIKIQFYQAREEVETEFHQAEYAPKEYLQHFKRP